MFQKKMPIFLLSFSLLSYLHISLLVIKKRDFLWDEQIFAFVEKISVIDAKMFQYITTAGSPKLLCFLALLLGFIFLIGKKDVYSFLFITFTPLAGSLLNRTLKHLYKRERPLINAFVEGSGYSFPSGHATASMIFFGCCIYLIFKSSWNLAVKWLSSIFLALLILLIGISRIYFRVHYPSDVFGGILFGFSVLMFSILLFKNRLKSH